MPKRLARTLEKAIGIRENGAVVEAEVEVALLGRQVDVGLIFLGPSP